MRAIMVTARAVGGGYTERRLTCVCLRCEGVIRKARARAAARAAEEAPVIPDLPAASG
jgi:hypothetical protein